ncbi:MAG: Gldg family protein [Lachnospiraceae bacterium]|nr:Gldg family protein [Lachnospiraceae bacterium]
MLAIYKRELRAYLHTVIGFIFVAANLFLIGLYFVVYNIFSNYPYFQYTMQSCGILMFISVPILTMRMIAEERKNKTDQLILTAPVSVVKIVLGKYLAAVTVFVIPCLVSCIYPVIMSKFGTIAWGEGYLGILGYFLLGAACIAIGTFISSLFENQIVAAVVAFVAIFIGYMMSSVCSLISSSGNLLTKILSIYDLSTPFNSFCDGTLEIGSIVYFVSIAALFLYLTVQSIQKRRYSVTAKHFTFGAYSIVGILIAIAIFVFVNIGVAKIPAGYTSFDLTYNKMYLLTDDTKNYLSKIDKDVNIYVLSNKTGYDESVAKTLEYYEGASKHVKVTYVDPSISPRFYANYTSSAPSSGSIIVSSDLRSKVVDYNDLYVEEYSMNYSTYGYDSNITGYDAEGQITGAIDYVLSEDMPKLLLTQGHGESNLDQTYTAALNKANVEYETVNLMELSEIPENAGCVLINGATGDISEDDLKKLTDYLDNGGKVVITLSLTDEELTNIKALAGYMNLQINQGIVLEDDTYHYYDTKMFIVPDINYSEQTAEVYSSGYKVFSPYNMGIIVPEDDDAVTYDVFLETTDSAFIKEDYMNMTTDNREDGDPTGPFAIGVAASKQVDSTEDGEAVNAEMIVYSSVTMFTQAADAMVSNTNQKVFIATVGKYMGKENAISIPSKAFDLGYITTTYADLIVISVITVILLPIALLVCGIVIWARRRKF